MLKVILLAPWMAVLLPSAALAQNLHLTPTTPGSPAPLWQRMVQLDDGRTFVTDGGMAIDAALVKPTLPNNAPASGKIIERYLSADLPDEFSLSELSPHDGRTYAAPSGIALNATYIDFVRRTLPLRQIRLRMKGDLDPVLITVDGKTVGVMMPVKR
jgi:hypothetical protein